MQALWSIGDKATRKDIEDILCRDYPMAPTTLLTFLKKTCGGNIAAFASALWDSGISKEELLELKNILKRSSNEQLLQMNNRREHCLCNLDNRRCKQFGY